MSQHINTLSPLAKETCWFPALNSYQTTVDQYANQAEISVAAHDKECRFCRISLEKSLAGGKKAITTNPKERE